MPGSMPGSMRRTMQRFWLGAFVVGAAIAVVAESRAQPASSEDAAVLAADVALGDAMRGGDKSIARKLLSLQFTFIDDDGKIYERKAFLDDLKAAAAAAPADVKVRIYGGVAAVTGKRKSAQDRDAFFLDIWAKQKGAWRALTMQDVVLAAADAPTAAPDARATEAKPSECKNPCQTIPYRVRSPAEQEIVNAFQAIEKAVVAHDAEEWGKHIGDEFVRYRTGDAAIAKSGRIAAIERQKANNSAVTVGEVETMRLSVYGDGAAMIATHVVPDNARPPYRAARIWARRNGQWQMVISVQTAVK
jgi:Domain of unknown function (DUF4440)